MTSISSDVAVRIAREELVRIGGGHVLCEDLTIATDVGWVFFYRAAEPGARLFGNAPILVDLMGGVHQTGTSYDVEDYLRVFRVLGAERYDRTNVNAFLDEEVPGRS